MIDNVEKCKLFDRITDTAGDVYTLTYKGEICGKNCTILETKNCLVTMKDGELKKYCKFEGVPEKISHNFGGFECDKILASGKDILAEMLLGKSFGFNDVKGLLPSSYDNGYLVIGSHTTANNYTVDMNGAIYRQPEYEVKNPGVLGFSPENISPLGKEKPEMSFLDGFIPILFNRHVKDGKTLETIYLVSQGNYFVEFPVWIRAAEYEDDNILSVKFYNADIGKPGVLTELDGNLFYDYFFAVLDYNNRFVNQQAYIDVPEKQLVRTFYGSMLTAEGQTDGFKLKYGNLIYNLETHDNFPPNYIAAINTYAMCGHLKKARLMAEHFLSNAVDANGRLVYRQGNSQTYGYSGSEIGQLLWTFDRYKGDWIKEYADILKMIGDNLIRTISQVEGHEDISLVHMCAEADTNGRVYDYIQNSLWSVHGLEALGRICDFSGKDGTKYIQYALTLRNSIEKATERFSVKTKYGEIIPFQLQYTALPLNLSKCNETAYEVTEEYLKSYFAFEADPHDDFENVKNQDFCENAYANYRYYPEILSAMLIDKKYADGIDNLRRKLGGEILGMTRFMQRLDDWPAYNNAIYLLETGQVERYRLLMYSHIIYHGVKEFGVYYEQVGFNTENMTVVADTSLPCNMLPAFMIAQMFCYTSVDGKTVELLKAVPENWFEKSFKVRKIYTSYGAVSVELKDSVLLLEFDGDFDAAVIKLYLPKNVVEIKAEKQKIELRKVINNV